MQRHCFRIWREHKARALPKSRLSFSWYCLRCGLSAAAPIPVPLLVMSGGVKGTANFNFESCWDGIKLGSPAPSVCSGPLGFDARSPFRLSPRGQKIANFWSDLRVPPHILIVWKICGLRTLLLKWSSHTFQKFYCLVKLNQIFHGNFLPFLSFKFFTPPWNALGHIANASAVLGKNALWSFGRCQIPFDER